MNPHELTIIHSIKEGFLWFIAYLEKPMMSSA